jgi:hypothetical protein
MTISKKTETSLDLTVAIDSALMNGRPVFKAKQRSVNNRYVGAAGQHFASPTVR